MINPEKILKKCGIKFNKINRMRQLGNKKLEELMDFVRIHPDNLRGEVYKAYWSYYDTLPSAKHLISEGTNEYDISMDLKHERCMNYIKGKYYKEKE